MTIMVLFGMCLLKRIEAENITWFYCRFYAYFNI